MFRSLNVYIEASWIGNSWVTSWNVEKVLYNDDNDVASFKTSSCIKNKSLRASSSAEPGRRDLKGELSSPNKRFFPRGVLPSEFEFEVLAKKNRHTFNVYNN